MSPTDPRDDEEGSEQGSADAEGTSSDGSRAGTQSAETPDTDADNAGTGSDSSGTETEETGESEATPSDSPSESGTKKAKGHDEQFCESCGAVIKKEAQICPECGVRTRGSARAGGSSKAGGAGGSAPKSEPMGRLAAAGIGGLVSLFVGGFLPIIGQIGGGAVSGYLRGPNTKESTITGALAGVIASIPAILLFAVLFFFGLLGSISEGANPAGVGSFFLVITILLVVVLAFYGGLGALGGALGSALSDRKEPDLD